METGEGSYGRTAPLAVDVGVRRFPKLALFGRVTLDEVPDQGSPSSAQLRAAQVKAAAAQESY